MKEHHFGTQRVITVREKHREQHQSNSNTSNALTLAFDRRIVQCRSGSRRGTQANGDNHEEGMKVKFNEMPNKEIDRLPTHLSYREPVTCLKTTFPKMFAN